MQTQFFRLVLFTCAWSVTAFASLTPPDDGPYRRLRFGRTLYVYHAGARDVIPDLAAYTQAYRDLYDHSFGWKLDEEQSLILLSPHTQVANGFATMQPNLKTAWYGSGPDLMESAAASSWLQLLAAHETSHLYQLNAKAPLSAALKTVFGSTPVITPLIWPVFLLPNEFLPLSFAEGNAVLNESRVNQGGRLHSGEERAQVLRLVAAGQFTPGRLINHEFRFPFRHADYALGSYFQAHLAGKYGVERTNLFFRAHAEHWLNPLRINATFRTHFGQSFYQEVREATRGLERLAEHQVIADGEWLTPATFVRDLNHDHDRVWWLTNPGYRTSTLHVMNKATREIVSRDLNLLAGKVFWDGDRPLTSSTNQNDLHHQTFGLYAENAILEPTGQNEVVTDVRGGHRVGFDARDAWRDPRIVRDGEPFEVGHSNPVLDDAGHVYFFRQHGADRLLYRDHELLTKFAGRYAKITEVDGKGAVWFIGATTYGSSLFKFFANEVTRAVASDAVLDARRLDDGHALLSEVDADGGHVVVAPLIVRSERPAVYAYPFASESLNPRPVLTEAEVARDERAYSAFRELRFSQAALGAELSGYGGTAAGATLVFTDPLEFNQLAAGASYSAYGSRTATAEYAYSRFLPRLIARYTYGDYRYRLIDGHERTIDQEADLGVSLNVLRRGIYDAGVEALGLIARDGGDAERDRTRTEVGASTSAFVQRRVGSPIGLYAWRLLRATLTHRASFDPSTGREAERAGALRLDWTHGFKGQRYVAAAAHAAQADERSINVGYESDLMPTAVGVPRLGLGPLMAVRAAGAVRAEVRQVFNVRAYDDRIPLGLNRGALIAAAQTTALAQSGRGNPKNILEYGLGFDLDVLALHQNSATVRIMLTHVSDPGRGQPDTQITLGISGY